MKTTITLLFLLILFNATAQYDPIFKPSVLDGSNGFRMTPTATSHSRLGHAVSFIGDINNDGIDDIAIGDDYDIGDGTVTRPGKVFVVFGSTSIMPADFDLSSLDGSNGFIIKGKAEEDRLGEVLTGIKDVNGDGIDDFMTIDNNGAIVIYGKTGNFPAVIERTDIDGSNGFIVEEDGITSVADAGDHNGDGINDFILGVPHWDEDAWIVFGRSDNFPATISSNYFDGTKGYKAVNFSIGSRPAYVVSGLGDVNNDGFDDVIVGAWTNSHIDTDIQMSYLVYGHAGPFGANLDLDNSTAAEAVQVSNEGNSFISRASSAGDINNDGIDDFVSDGNVFFGSTTAYPRVLSQKTLDGTNGFHLPKFSFPAPIGDFNNDGIDDLILDGALVLFGKSTSFTASLDLDYFDGTKGFRFDTNWSDDPGSAGRGDFNGDGIDDILTRTMVLFGGKNISSTPTSYRDNFLDENQLIVYPNPVKDILNITTDESMIGGSLIITSYSGKEVYKELLSNRNQKLDVSTLTSGLYILSIINEGYGVQRVKFNKL
ncbi:T9SS type A sorting domain-containing protein [Labilibacter marinus]|uniref:T9SS type A sorting domain-containing protein n=1 Tax=Labilibacter marinus TaxID=1477105 RepID=UPI00130157B3|nr:T9SS type A sorting domain-containing protein [Labilibacter marinus]